MRFHVKHVSRYSYSRPVFCEPLEVRLRPRENDRQKLERFRITVDPAPAGECWLHDEYGNVVFRGWFDRLTSNLRVTTSFVAESTHTNPFDFLLLPAAGEVPLKLPESQHRVLRPYLVLNSGEGVAKLAEELRQQTGGDTLMFLSVLAQTLYQRIEYILRPHGEPWAAEETLSAGQGSCRDATVLFNEVCRVVGIPARFVSGYSEGGLEAGEQYVHAWSEVFLPGAGWVGYDASLGLAVSDQHLAVACGVDSRGAAPIAGSFRGTGSRSKLQTQLIVRTDAASGQSQSQGEGIAPDNTPDSATDELRHA